MSEARAVKLLQGYLWYPRKAAIDLSDYLPKRLEPDLHLLWDEVRPPFAFFDDGTPAASQHVFQFTVVKMTAEDEDPGRLLPWLAETLQEKLNATPASVGWQLFEDLREI
jgi:hypothetical protein